MKEQTLIKRDDRKGEEGAALIMALLISVMLMIASVGLILETTNNTYNVTDMTSEQQAYNAAESGIQAAVNVLRDNITLPDDDRLDTTLPATAKRNRINYIRAIDLDDSNAAGDSSLVPRLSRWMPYDSTMSDRVLMGGSNDYAYKVELSDPDHTGALVTYSTWGKFSPHDIDTAPDPDTHYLNQITYGNTTNGFKFEYIAQPVTQVDTTNGLAASALGTIRVTKYGNGVQIVSPNRYEIRVAMTQPYLVTRFVRGFIKPNAETSPGSGVWTVPDVTTDSRTFTMSGSQLVLTSIGGNAIGTTYSTTEPAGYTTPLAPIVSSNTPVNNAIAGTLSSPEPIRLVIKATGYGPRGATKQLEAVIQKNFFNGLAAPATLTLVGPDHTDECTTCNPQVPETDTTFNPGSSNVTAYSGQDEVSHDIIPPIGTTNGNNLETVNDSVDGLPPFPFNGNVIGVPTNVLEEIPPWLSSPEMLDGTIKSLYNVALAAGRYFPSGTPPTNYGNYAAGQGITFCDGDCILEGEGGGILVVTGELTVHGNWAFRGLIIVTGQDGVRRTGGGNGEIYGNMVVVPYVNSSVLPASEPAGAFLAPQYDLSGGGNSTIAYNSTAMNDSLLAVDNFVLGVMEK